MKQSLFFKSLSQNPIPVDSKNQRIRVADILADDNDDEDCVVDFGMDWRRRSDGSTSLQCSSPRRIVARWLAALRRAKERRNGMVRARRSMNGLNGGDSSPSASESEESGDRAWFCLLLWLGFVVWDCFDPSGFMYFYWTYWVFNISTHTLLWYSIVLMNYFHLLSFKNY